MMELSRAGRAIAYIGAAAQLAGLGWDAVLHRLDPDLAAREGIFTLTNPGHVLFAGGLALVIAGVGMMLLAAGRGGRVARLGLAGALAVLSVGTLALAATSDGGLTGHSHAEAETVHVHEDGTSHTHAEHEAFLQSQSNSDGAQASAGHDHASASSFGAFGDESQSRHQHAADIPMSMADLQKVNEQLATA